MFSQAVTASLSAGGGFSPTLAIWGKFSFSLSGVFTGTVTLQRSFDGGTTWLDVATYTSPIEDAGDEPVYALYRAGFKAGEYTSGTAEIRLAR